MSTMPRSLSLAVSMVATLSASAFLRSRELVISVTSRCALAASLEWLRPMAMTIWLFQRGMVLTRVDWIFSDMAVSLLWISRICGAICMEIVLVSSRSYIFFSKRSHIEAKSLAACVSSGRPLCSAFFKRAGRSVLRACSSFFFPARIYMDSSLK